MPSEKVFGVWLHEHLVGHLRQRGDYTWFSFEDAYINSAMRDVLGLVFEEDLTAPHASALRLPPWFSNLLPEGRLRDWIANDRGVSIHREMELLAQVGADLPGAVRVLPADEEAERLASPEFTPGPSVSNKVAPDVGWRFSLAGVGLKFSMLRQGDRLVLPAAGKGGDWIVKLPDALHPDVPMNEFAMMRLAVASGLNVPETLLVPRGEIDDLPPHVWPGDENFAYAVRRFDRTENRGLVHIEDFAQVRNIFPYGNNKYQGSFETVAALCYRGRDGDSLLEFVRRLTFNILISNGDAHLKNWSLIYLDRRTPTLSPVYDLVSTDFYRDENGPENLGLKFTKTRRFEMIRLDAFDRLQDRLGFEGPRLSDTAAATVSAVQDAWPSISDLLSRNVPLQESIGQSIETRARTMTR